MFILHEECIRLQDILARFMQEINFWKSRDSFRFLARRMHSIYKELHGISVFLARFCIPCQLGTLSNLYKHVENKSHLVSLIKQRFVSKAVYCWKRGPAGCKLPIRYLKHPNGQSSLRIAQNRKRERAVIWGGGAVMGGSISKQSPNRDGCVSQCVDWSLEGGATPERRVESSPFNGSLSTHSLSPLSKLEVSLWSAFAHLNLFSPFKNCFDLLCNQNVRSHLLTALTSVKSIIKTFCWDRKRLTSQF